MQCSATIVHSDYEGCFKDAQPDLEHLLACAASTAESVEVIENCVDALANQECVTQTEADEGARAAEMNISRPPNPDPPECDFLKWLSDC